MHACCHHHPLPSCSCQYSGRWLLADPLPSCPVLARVPAAGCMAPQVADFWHEVELALNVRQASMFQAVNAHLERLARAVDSVVGDLLALRLEPVVVRMDPPSAAQFHSSLQELFERGACSSHDSGQHAQGDLLNGRRVEGLGKQSHCIQVYWQTLL